MLNIPARGNGFNADFIVNGFNAGSFWFQKS